MQLFKTCKRCKEAKPLDLFGKDKNRKDGFNCYCKECERDRGRQKRETKEGRQASLDAGKKSYQKRISTNNGKEKQLEYARKFLSNPENREKSRARVRKWLATPIGRQKSRVSSLAWSKNNPEKANALKSKRRAMKLQAIPKWFDKEKVDLVYAKAKEWNMEVDHVIPLQGKNVCGLHVWENLQLLDKSLNSSKGNKYAN
jgi:hypothetical protein